MTLQRGRPKSSERKPKLMTDVEIVIMNVLWNCGEATVKEVVEKLPQREARKLTTVATFLKIMDKKGFVTSRMTGRSLAYSPTTERESYQLIALKDLRKRVFNGSTIELVGQCLDEFQFGRCELEQLLRQIEYRKPT
ncbi:BlaI/MecI/CopY family transcriptional regulator [Ruegeria sp. MALMAid1280]|uniref:BlaI/MecI/CopY family transcriptional regulator n=1 Tax=Ruegeria sp. MALMAid1280 TaxID=3411634 RepID=UPI003BA0A860